MSAPLSAGEVRLECFKRLSNARLDFLDRLCDQRSIIEQYLNSDGNIHLHFSVGIRRWCANYICCGAGERSTSNDCASLDVHKSIMFVEVIEVAEAREPIRSVVRLASLDHCSMSVANSFELGMTPRLKHLAIAFNRELSTRWLAIGIKECESVNEIIEGTAQVITNLSNQDGRCSGNGNYCRLTDARSHNEIVRRIRVKLGHESILVFSGEGIEPSLQVSKVFFCPSYTKEGVIEAVTGRGTFHG